MALHSPLVLQLLTHDRALAVNRAVVSEAMTLVYGSPPKILTGLTLDSLPTPAGETPTDPLAVTTTAMVAPLVHRVD